MATNQSVTLFISYAHRDEELKSQLDKHLTPLKLQKVIDKWSDRHIEGGQDWAHQIDSNLKSADIILLLVSPDFVSSDYCAGVELKAAMTRYRDGDAIVVPVILEPCDWKWLDFGKLQATPKDGKAITDWANINSAFLDVTNTIRQIAQGLLDKRQKKLDEILAASARYKAKVEEVLSDGDITPLERKTLNELRDKLGLTPDEAEAIKDSAYQPLREYQGKLAQYRVDLVETIQHEYPLSERTKVDLKQRQRELGLKAEDADRIEVELLAGAEASYQAQLKSGEAALQRARAEAELRARDAAEAAEAAKAGEAAKAALAAEAAKAAEAAEAAKRAADAEAKRQAGEADRRRVDDERQQRAVRQARESAAAMPQPDVVSLQLQQAPAAAAGAAAGAAIAAPPPHVPQPPMSQTTAAAAVGAEATGASVEPPITSRARLVAAGIGAAICGLSQLPADGAVFVIVLALVGAMAGAITAGYRWIGVAAALSFMAALAGTPAAVLAIMMFLVLIVGSAVILIQRRLKARK